MGPGTMSDQSMSLQSNNSHLAIPKLHDDGSNWADYEPRVRKAMGAKGIWKHDEGTAYKPLQYNVVNGVHVLADGKTPASEDQIESREAKVDEYEQCQYLAQHVILLMMSPRLGAKIKNMSSAHDMWDEVKKDATSKSTLHLIDAEDQLASMRCSESTDPKAHLAEIKAHFELMTVRRDNLISMGSTLSDTRFNTMIMMSLPPSYRPALQTITAATKLGGTTMQATNLIAFFIEEAEHRVIEEQRSSYAESAMMARIGKNPKKGGKGAKKPAKPNITCKNCEKPGHTDADCWAKGGGKEGQGPCLKKKAEKDKGKAKSDESTSATAAVAADDNLFAFSCTSNFRAACDDAEQVKDLIQAIVNSGASCHFTPHKDKLLNYKPIVNKRPMGEPLTPLAWEICLSTCQMEKT
jgi:hypothetical protein